MNPDIKRLMRERDRLAREVQKTKSYIEELRVMKRRVKQYMPSGKDPRDQDACGKQLQKRMEIYS